MDRLILLDNGHGKNTLGKRSPDGSLMEWSYTRKIVKLIYKELSNLGYNVHILVPEEEDIALSERRKRINKFCEEYNNNVLMISVHVNAAGDYGWHNARGWQVHTNLDPTDQTKNLANILFDTANELKLKTRKPSPSQNYWMNDFYIIKRVNCPAVLTENLFQDNIDDVEFLLSDIGIKTIVKLHVDSIMKFIK